MMSERIDHAAEALKCLKDAAGHYALGAKGVASLESSAAIAHSNLAIAEQLRVANIIALAHVADTSDAVVTPLEQDAWNALGVQGSGEMRPEIREVLGL